MKTNEKTASIRSPSESRKIFIELIINCSVAKGYDHYYELTIKIEAPLIERLSLFLSLSFSERVVCVCVCSGCMRPHQAISVNWVRNNAHMQHTHTRNAHRTCFAQLLFAMIAVPLRTFLFRIHIQSTQMSDCARLRHLIAHLLSLSLSATTTASDVCWFHQLPIGFYGI